MSRYLNKKMIRHTLTHLHAPLSALSIALSLTACGGGGANGSGVGGVSSSTGSLSLSISDAPVDNADAVWVEFTGIELKRENSNSVNIDFAQPKRINLLALTGSSSEFLLNGQTLSAGTYSWIRLKVNASESGDPADDSYIVIAGTPRELRIPSGAQTGLKLNRPITIPEDGSASFTIDFDLRKSIHERSGGIYQLRPTLRLVDNSLDGTLSGRLNPTTISTRCLAGDKAAVYVYEGANITPDDVNINGNDVEPIATARVYWESGNNNYTVAFLQAGTYTAAFTCDAGRDDPAAEDSLSFVAPASFTIVAGQTILLNF